MKWIPIKNKKKPDINQKCICTVLLPDFNHKNRIKRIQICSYRKNGFVTTAADGRVIAWMPAPEPWKGEEDD